METLFIGKKLIFLPEIPSTNSYAMELLKNVNPAEGTVVYAAHQLAGRGQRGSTWAAAPGQNLLASVILKPTFLAPKNHHYLTYICALALYDTVAQFADPRQFDIKIKWPNDILADEVKISGILIENNVQQNEIKWSVAGIGLNVNQAAFSGLSATSLFLLTGKRFEGKEVLSVFCSCLEKHYLRLKAGKLDVIREEYLSRLFALNKPRVFERDGRSQEMTITGVNENGMLLLRNAHGEVEEAGYKEVGYKLKDRS